MPLPGGRGLEVVFVVVEVFFRFLVVSLLNSRNAFRKHSSI